MHGAGPRVQIRYSDGDFPTHSCAVAAGRIYPRPEEVQSCDLMANGFMLDVGAGENEQKAIEIAEELWEGAEKEGGKLIRLCSSLPTTTTKPESETTSG